MILHLSKNSWLCFWLRCWRLGGGSDLEGRVRHFSLGPMHLTWFPAVPHA